MQSVAQTRSINWNVVKAIPVIYLLIYIFLPIRRVLYEWPESTAPTYGNLMDWHKIIPVGIILLPMLLEGVPKFREWWIRNINLQFINSVLAIFILVCFGLTVAEVPGIWFSWLGVGAQAAALMIITNILNRKYSIEVSFMIGIASVIMTIGLWETLYQSANYFNVPSFGMNSAAWHNEIIIELPYILPAFLIFMFYVHKIRFNWLMVILPLLFVGMWALWFHMGYWIDIQYSDDHGWFYNKGTASGLFQLQLAKTSKVVMLGFWLSLFLKGKEDK